MTDLSFEFFPPKNADAEARLWEAVTRLAPLAPAFVSVTYGAGGSTRDRTHNCVRRIVAETPLSAAAHLTCVGASRDEIDKVVDDYAAAGVRHIVALRGDMPDMGAYRPAPNGYAGSVALVRALRARGGFEISVSAYPETHPDSKSRQADIELLKAKIEAGAVRAITQFCFDTDTHLRFRDAVRKAGVTIPICAGIMPTTNFKGVRRMAGLCGASLPDWLCAQYDGRDDDLITRQKIATEIAVEQCQKLLAEGFSHLHFYTLNQAELTFAVCRHLGLGGAQ